VQCTGRHYIAYTDLYVVNITLRIYASHIEVEQQYSTMLVAMQQLATCNIALL